MMKILAIETSCDETAISIVLCEGEIDAPVFLPISEVVVSQLALHAHWGGVVPTLAKREHEKALVPVLQEALGKAELLNSKSKAKNARLAIATSKRAKQSPPLAGSRQDAGQIKIQNILKREETLLSEIIKFLDTYDVPNIDAIAVTQGPGLEPALWVGINFAKTLAFAWQKPLIPVNHMEGHLVSATLTSSKVSANGSPRSSESGAGESASGGKSQKSKVLFPAIGLLVSGGHTELVLVKAWGDYQKIGATRDDAAGEAFDKVARLLGLGYPGGPAISDHARKHTGRPTSTINGRSRSSYIGGLNPPRWGETSHIKLPRPMINSGDFDFSFSGLKTAVLYLIKNLQKDDPLILEHQEIKALIAHGFQEAVVDVLVTKTMRAAEEYGAKSIIAGGGVSANKRLREMFEDRLRPSMVEVGLPVFFPTPFLSTDNATMIAAAAYINILCGKKGSTDFEANGNLSL